MVAGLGVWALWQSLGTTSAVLKKSLYAYTIYSAALTPVILAAFFWRRATAAGAVLQALRRAPFVTVLLGYRAREGASAAVHLAARDAILPAHCWHRCWAWDSEVC